MSTPAYVSAADTLVGNSATEAGIQISSFKQSWADEKLYLENKTGSKVGFAHNFDTSSSCSIEGETITAFNIVMGVVFGVAETISNMIASTAYTGANTGGFYLEDIEVSTARKQFATATANLIKHPDIT